MLRAGQPVTFRGLAAAAPVSLDFLYRNPAIRQRVEQLRAQQQAPAAPARKPGTQPDQPGNVIAALTGELAQLKSRHRERIAELHRALQAAHGENLILRRRLGQQQQQRHSPRSVTGRRTTCTATVTDAVRHGTTWAMSNFYTFAPRITSVASITTAGTCQLRSQSASASTSRLVVPKLRVSLARRAGLLI